MIFGFGKKQPKAKDLIIASPTSAKTPENYQALLIDEGELKDWADAPNSISAKGEEKLFHISKETFEIEFSPQPDNAPQLGVKAIIQFQLQEHDYRLANFLDDNDRNFSLIEISSLVEDCFPQPSLMPQMTGDEWARARADFSNALQSRMGMKCLSLKEVFLEDQQSLQESLAGTRYENLFDEETGSEALATPESSNIITKEQTEKEKRDKLVLAIQLDSWKKGGTWWQNLEKADGDLQERIQKRLSRSIKQAQHYQQRNSQLSDEEWKEIKRLNKRLAHHQKSIQSLPALNPNLTALKRSRREQKQMLNNMQNLMESSRELHSFIRGECQENTAISTQALQRFSELEQQLEHAIQQRRNF